MSEDQRPDVSRHSLFVAALREPIDGFAFPLHRHIAQECEQDHADLFPECREASCVLLRRIARSLGWTITERGVTNPWE